MIARTRTLSIAACAGTLMFATGIFGGIFANEACAQGSDSNVRFESGLLPKKPRPGLPEVRPQPLAWPRLDPGAVLCRTETDLDRLAERRHGQVVEGPVDCQVIHNPTAVAILQRNGPGRTEVKVSAAPAGDTGWTDAWLPEKAPSPGPRSASR